MVKKTIFGIMCAVMLIGCGGTVTDGGASSDGGTAPVVREELRIINDYRAHEQYCGVYGYMGPSLPLLYDEGLEDASYEHSVDMEVNMYFSHIGSGTEEDITATYLNLDTGSTPEERVTFHVPQAYYIGENIAMGVDNIDDAFTLWMNSAEHCRNIMDPEYTFFGMAKSPDGNYWTQNFSK